MILPSGGSSGAARSLLICGIIASTSGVSGCSAALELPPTPPATEIPSLERQAAEDPLDLRAAVRLGAAYWGTARLPEAEAELSRARRLDPLHPAPAFFLAVTFEDMGRFAEARAEYLTYLESGSSDRLRSAVRDRLGLLARKELEASVRSALSREAELAALAPRANTVGLFPLLYTGADPRYQPLGRALAEMLVTDLSQTDRLTVVERSRVQFLLDEIALGEAGVVDSTTAARAGRLLGAGRIVQGRLDAVQESLLVEALVVPVGDDALGRSPRVSDRDVLQRLWDLQVRLALELYGTLGVQLTPAERERVHRRPTENLQALLAFGAGLAAEDNGGFAQAAEHYQAAVDLDPGFTDAAERAEEARALEAASQTSTERLAQLDGTDLMTAPGPEDWARLEISLIDMWRYLPDFTGREPAPEIFGTEGVGAQSRVRIDFIFRTP